MRTKVVESSSVSRRDNISLYSLCLQRMKAWCTRISSEQLLFHSVVSCRFVKKSCVVYRTSLWVRRLEMMIFFFFLEWFGLQSGLALISRHSGNGTFKAEVNGKMCTVPPQQVWLYGNVKMHLIVRIESPFGKRWESV